MENFYRKYNRNVIVTGNEARDTSVFNMLVRDMHSVLKNEAEKRGMSLRLYQHPYAVTGYLGKKGLSIFFAWTCPKKGHPVNLDECSAMNGLMYRIHSIKRHQGKEYLNACERFSSWNCFMDNVDSLLNESAVIAELSAKEGAAVL